jgi:photosystem II stability/assembly factor-like uncharacterized protein
MLHVTSTTNAGAGRRGSRDVVRRLALCATGLLLAAAPAALAQLAPTTPSMARDVSPDPGFTFGVSESYLFHGATDVLAASGRAGAHRSESRGDRWMRSMRGFVDPTGLEPAIVGFCQAPSAPATVYSPASGDEALFFDRLYRTDDFGLTWRPLAPLDGFTGIDCAVDPRARDVVYYLTIDPFGQSRLERSVDGGLTFVPAGAGLEPLDGPSFVRVAPTDPSKVYAGGTGAFGGVYASSDGGATFARLAASPANPVLLQPHPTRAGTLLVVTADGGLYRSEDGGASFSLVTGVPATVVNAKFDRADPSVIYAAAGLAGLFGSRDGGATFSRVAGPAPDQLGQFGVSDVGVPPDARGSVYVTTSLGPYRSDDGGRTFIAIQRGYHGAAVNDLGFDAAGRLLVGVNNTVTLFRAVTPRLPGVYEIVGDTIPGAAASRTAAIAASHQDPNVLAVALADFRAVYRSGDGGRSWTRASFVSDPPLDILSRATRMAFAPNDSNRLYLVAGAGLFQSSDAGVSFQQTFAEPLGSVAVDPTNADVVYVGTWAGGDGLFKSIDGGVTFQSLGMAGNFGAIAIDPRRPQTIYAGSRGGGVLRSLDGGATWALASQGLPGGEVLGLGVDPHVPSHVFAWIKAEGVFRSDDGAGTWSAADTGEAARRSGVAFGRGTLAIDPVHSGRVYIGNSGVVQIDTIP